MILAYLLQDTGTVYGAERATLDLASGMAARGHVVRVLLMRESRLGGDASELEAAFRARGLDVITVETRSRFSMGLIRRIGRILDDQDVQVLHTVGYKADVHGLLARGRVPHVSTVHGWLFRADLKERFYGWLNLQALRRCARVISLSRYYESYLAKRGITGGRLVRIPSGLDPAGLGPRPAHSGTFTVGIMGRLSEEKNHAMLLRAAARVRDVGVTFRLLIAGSGPLADAVDAQVARLDLKYVVERRGYVPREDFLSCSDVVVLCSRIENLPYSVMEAMASGLPVIGTRVGGLPDLVDDGLTGYLVESDDDAALADRIIRLAKDAGTRGRLGAAGRGKLEGTFTLDACLDAHEKLYASVAR